MKIVVPIKVVADDQDIVVAGDSSLDFSKAKPIVSAYDLNALEAAAQLAEATDSSVVAISVGGASIDDSKLKKNILARGVDELFMIADDASADLDAHATAAALVELVGKVGEYDVIICGDGSADLYAQQVDVQLAAALDLPYVSGAVKLEGGSGTLAVSRMLETEVEEVEVPLPAVVSVSPDIALPRICGMKDILAAGKKPSSVEGATAVAAAAIEVLEQKAPEQADRKGEVFNASSDGDLDSFIAAVKAAL